MQTQGGSLWWRNRCNASLPRHLIDWGLRDYGTGEWVGGDAECDHVVGNQVQDNKAPGAITSGIRPGTDTSHCKKCGAIRQDKQLGIETVHDCLGWATDDNCGECYVCHTRQWAAECWRVLKDDGVFFLNIGDSFYGGKGKSSQAWSGSHPDRKTLQKSHHHIAGKGETRPTDAPLPGLKPKDLMGIPWRVALALQVDGWYLRSDIIWAKNNPMPESVTDRPTKSHEYVFMLTKNRYYYYDYQAIKERANPQSAVRYEYEFHVGQKESSGAGRPDGAKNTPGKKQFTGTRNKRSVWTINAQSFSGAHFATFPEELVLPCIKAGSKRGDIVLDPFCGSGTVGEVCRHLGRKFVGIDLSFTYLDELARKRTGLNYYVSSQSERDALQDAPLFALLGERK